MSLFTYVDEAVRLTKILSGGQYGTDLGALEAAFDMGLETGGHCPRFFKTCHGPNPELGSKFNLIETTSIGYKKRTELNVINSDGTLVIASDFNSAGTRLTIDLLKAHVKPYFTIKVPFYPASLEAETLTNVVGWLTVNNIATLNVAGNRDKSTEYGDNFHYAYYFLLKLFFKYYKERLNHEKS